MKILQLAAGLEGNNTRFIWEAAPMEKTKPTITIEKKQEEIQKITQPRKSLGKEIEEKSLMPKKRVEKRIAELKKIFGIKDIVFSQDSKYDYEDVEKNIPNMFRSLMEIKRINPEAMKALSTVTLIASPQGFSIDFDGVKEKDLIAFDYDEDPEEIADDIIEGLIELKKIGEDNFERCKQLRRKLDSIGAKYGIPTGTLVIDRENIEEYKELEKSFSNIDQALKMLIQQRPDVIEAIKNSGKKTGSNWSGGRYYYPRVEILVDFQGFGSNILDDNYEQSDKVVSHTVPAAYGGGRDNVYNIFDRKIISIDYDESPQEIVDDIIDGLVDFELLKDEVNPFHVLESLEEIERKYGIRFTIKHMDSSVDEHDVEDLNKYTSNIDEVLNKIKEKRPDALEALKKIPLHISHQGIDSLRDLKDSIPANAISFDYDESPDEIADDIINELIERHEISN